MDTGNDAHTFKSYLLPWYERLRQGGSCRARGAWIQVSHGNVPVEFLEGLALLALLAQHDQRVWSLTMKEIWPESRNIERLATEAANAEEETVCAVRTSWKIRSIEHLDSLRCFIASTHEPSAAFNQAVQTIKASVSRDKNAAELPRVSFCIDADWDCPGTDELTGSLRTIYDLAKAMHLVVAPGGVRFAIDRVNNLLCAGPSLGLAGLDLLAKIVKLGICIDSFPVINCELADRGNGPKLLHAARSILLPNTDASTGIHTVQVANNGSKRVLMAVLSALKYNSSVHGLRIQRQDDLETEESESWGYQRDLWTVISECLFSRRAQHHVKSLELHLEMFDDEAFDGVMAGLADMPSFSPLCDPDQRRCVTATHFFLEYPGERVHEEHEPSEHQIYNSDEPIDAYALKDSAGPDTNGWWWCLLPGWGHAWVRRDDVLSVCRVQNDAKATESCSFDEIILREVCDQSMESVVGLLAVIGRDTRKLEIEEHIAFQLEDDWASQLFTVCPKLEELRFTKSAFTSLESFTACAVNGDCRLRSISLSRISLEDPDRVLGFFRALCDSNYSLTVNLQDLSVGFTIVEPDVGALVDVLREMLLKNRSLRKIHLQWWLPASQECVHDLLESQLSRFTTEMVAVRTSPLDMGSKVAFLSVLDAIQAITETMVDSHILSSIFQYAAPAVTREFQLSLELSRGREGIN